MKVHQIKCWQQFFQPLITGQKPFEYRLNDRKYEVGDGLEISETFMDNTNDYFTGRKAYAIITYVLDRNKHNTVPVNYVVLGIRLVNSFQDEVIGNEKDFAPLGAAHEVYDFQEN